MKQCNAYLIGQSREQVYICNVLRTVSYME